MLDHIVCYDANGNALTRQGSSIGWTSYNYPTAVNAGSGRTAESVAFSYGPDRKRWQQVYTGNSISETTNYIGGLLEQVTSAGVTDYRHYIYGGSEPVAVLHRNSSGSNGLNYLLSDHQGSVASINASGSGATTEVSESYTPFGLRRNPPRGREPLRTQISPPAPASLAKGIRSRPRSVFGWE